METCPKNIKCIIASYLNYFDLRNLSRTCKSWAKLCQGEEFWRYLGSTKFNCSTLDRKAYCDLINEKLVRELMVEQEMDDELGHDLTILIKDNILLISLVKDEYSSTHMMIFDVKYLDYRLLEFYTEAAGAVKLKQFDRILVYDSQEDHLYGINTVTTEITRIEIESPGEPCCGSAVIYFLSQRCREVHSYGVTYHGESVIVTYNLLENKIHYKNFDY